jgi:hypothetical protein
MLHEQDEVRLFSIGAQPSSNVQAGGWWGSTAKPHRQLWPMQSISGSFIG